MLHGLPNYIAAEHAVQISLIHELNRRWWVCNDFTLTCAAFWLSLQDITTMPELQPIPEQAPVVLSGRASEIAQQIEQVLLCTGSRYACFQKLDALICSNAVVRLLEFTP